MSKTGLILLLVIMVMRGAFAATNRQEAAKISLRNEKTLSLVETDDYCFVATLWPEVPAISYFLLAPYPSLFSKSASDKCGLIPWCREIHNNFIKKNENLSGITNLTYWFGIIPTTEHSWQIWRSLGGWTSKGIPANRDEELFVWQDRIWENVPEVLTPPAAFDFVAKSPAGKTNHVALCYAVSLAPDVVSYGSTVRIRVREKNLTDQRVFIPNFIRTPVQAVAIDQNSMRVFKLKGCPGNTPDIAGWMVAPRSEEIAYSIDLAINATGNPLSIDLPPGKYVISILDLSWYGFPSSCISSTLTILP